MSVLKLITRHNPILRQPCKPVEVIDESVQELIFNMIETAKAFDGIGLAAPQVGSSLQIFVALVGFTPKAYINPKIELGKIQRNSVEGCLSIPGIERTVLRSKHVRIKYQDINGEQKMENASGLLSRVIQHEYDHLCGVLIIDK